MGGPTDFEHCRPAWQGNGTRGWNFVHSYVRRISEHGGSLPQRCKFQLRPTSDTYDPPVCPTELTYVEWRKWVVDFLNQCTEVCIVTNYNEASGIASAVENVLLGVKRLVINSLSPVDDILELPKIRWFPQIEFHFTSEAPPPPEFETLARPRCRQRVQAFFDNERIATPRWKFWRSERAPILLWRKAVDRQVLALRRSTTLDARTMFVETLRQRRPAKRERAT